MGHKIWHKLCHKLWHRGCQAREEMKSHCHIDNVSKRYQPTDGPMDGRTQPVIEMRGCI